MFALHRGSFFGTGGVVLFMVTSFGMPLFAVTGWMLYLDRRRRKRVVREVSDSIAGPPLALPPAPDDGAGDAPLLVLHASQTGKVGRASCRERVGQDV